MPTDEAPLPDLKADFDALVAAYERDRFAARLIYKLNAKDRARMGVICFSAGIGAALAASQFSGLVQSLSPVLTPITPENASGLSMQLFASVVFAGLLTATIGLVRSES